MKASPRFLVLPWVALGVVVGCGGVTLQPSDGGSTAGHGGGRTGAAGDGGTAGGSGGSQAGHAGDAGQDGGAGGGVSICSALDESRCSATQGCAALACPTCSGQTVFSMCYRAEGAPPPSCVPMGCPAPESCNVLGETACGTRADCHLGYCANCSGAQLFTQCLDSNQAIACPGYACPAVPACDGLGEMACQATPGCGPHYCPNCSGGQNFVGCIGPGESESACPLLTCPAPAACSTVTTEAVCNARTDCHSVFVDPGTCGCNAVGCCAHFSWCADGAKASCGGMPLCQVVAPHCEAPAFVVSYTGSCFEGCVRPTECGP
jgi:hypothetical protein